MASGLHVIIHFLGTLGYQGPRDSLGFSCSGLGYLGERVLGIPKKLITVLCSNTRYVYHWAPKGKPDGSIAKVSDKKQEELEAQAPQIASPLSSREHGEEGRFRAH